MGPSKLDANIALSKRGASIDFCWRRFGRALYVRMVDAIMRRTRRQAGKRAKRATMELDEHLLRDIGLSRSELLAAAFGILPLEQAAAKVPDEKPAWAKRRDPAAAIEPRRLTSQQGL
jgi:uncharacterized protein YjiS (DUF1127 family)